MMQGATVLAGALLTARLYDIQFTRGAELRTRAEANRFVAREVEADRGVMYDASGELVVANKPRFTVSVVTAALPPDGSELEAVLKYLVDVLAAQADAGTAVPASLPDQEEPSALEAEASLMAAEHDLTAALPYSGARLIRTWRSVPVARSISRDAAFKLMEASWRMPGVFVGEAPVRDYPAGPTMAHLLGFTGAIPPEQLEDYGGRGYAIYDVVGRSGLEATYEPWLRGRKGAKVIEVDASGRELRSVGQPVEPRPGNSLVLTVDVAFQRAVEEILGAALDRIGAQSGAVVALDPRDGAVRALVSLPTFDNNLFSVGASPEAFAALLADERRPLLNRATSGQYPPGSTFKIITAAAGLAEGVISRSTRIVDPGVIVLPNQYNPDITYPFYCWLRSGHGALDVVGALAQSCDVFFYEVAGGYHENGADQPGLGSAVLGSYAREFGLGAPSGIELLGEASGRVPSAAWLQEALDLPWTTGETYNMGIGQSHLLVTPLQMALATGAVANGGTVFRPHLVDRVVDADGEVALRPGGVVRTLRVSAEILATVRQGMRNAVLAGTARPAWSRLPSGVAVAGKTGTAEFYDPVVTPDGVFPRRDRDGNLLTHAWFVAFAPYEAPEIALAVFVDGSGLDHIIEGSQVAAPIAGDVLRAWFNLPETTAEPADCDGCPPVSETPAAPGPGEPVTP
jgi:penicillin-binding protein 2